jgi:S-adenosylmethionine uptake transporter
MLAPLIYSQLLWSIIYSVILFDEIPSNSLYSGSGLIIAAGLVVIFKDKIIQIKQAD